VVVASTPVAAPANCPEHVLVDLPAHWGLYGADVEIEVLTVADCPHRVRALDWVRDALARVGRPDVAITERQVGDATEAARLGMHESPTILVDGRDLFGDHGAEPSLSCRFYRSAAGVDGAPSVDALVDALR